MIIRRFNENGLARYAAWLDELRKNPALVVPHEMLEDEALTAPLGVEIVIETQEFPRRFEAAEYLYEVLHGRGLVEPERDAGLWAWLSLFYFEQLCPVGKGGERKVSSTDSYIPLVHVRRRYYRHLLLGPYLIWRSFGRACEEVEFLLAPPLDVATDEVYRLLVEGPLIYSRAAVGTATRLYWEAARAQRKRGAGTKTAGGMRRFVAVLQQFDRTMDLHTIGAPTLVQMLPKEFTKFRGG